MRKIRYLYSLSILLILAPFNVAIAQDNPPTNLVECLNQCIAAYPDRGYECSTSCDQAFGSGGRDDSDGNPVPPSAGPRVFYCPGGIEYLIGGNVCYLNNPN